jgi:hypothetical protein
VNTKTTEVNAENGGRRQHCTNAAKAKTKKTTAASKLADDLGRLLTPTGMENTKNTTK